MSTFPKLKTQAITQYPSTRMTTFSTGIASFMDGQEQRFRDFSRSLLSWSVDLSLLDDLEMSTLENFFIVQNGSFSSFDFEDPWNGMVHSGCTLQNPEAVFEYVGPQTGSTHLIVQQNRS